LPPVRAFANQGGVPIDRSSFGLGLDCSAARTSDPLRRLRELRSQKPSLDRDIQDGYSTGDGADNSLLRKGGGHGIQQDQLLQASEKPTTHAVRRAKSKIWRPIWSFPRCGKATRAELPLVKDRSTRRRESTSRRFADARPAQHWDRSPSRPAEPPTDAQTNYGTVKATGSWQQPRAPEAGVVATLGSDDPRAATHRGSARSWHRRAKALSRAARRLPAVKSGMPETGNTPGHIV